MPLRLIQHCISAYVCVRVLLEVTGTSWLDLNWCAF